MDVSRSGIVECSVGQHLAGPGWRMDLASAFSEKIGGLDGVFEAIGDRTDTLMHTGREMSEPQVAEHVRHDGQNPERSSLKARPNLEDGAHLAATSTSGRATERVGNDPTTGEANMHSDLTPTSGVWWLQRSYKPVSMLLS